MLLAICVVLTLGGLIAVVAGLYLQHHALSQYGSESAPRMPSWNPRLWRLSWKTADWFSDPRGLTLLRAGDLLLIIGPLAAIAGIILKKIMLD